MADRKIFWLRPKDLAPVLLSSFLALSGCTTPNPQEKPSPTPYVNPYLDRSTYPELSSFPLHSEGDFNTASGKVKWLNFTDFNFQADIAEQIFRHFESWPLKSPYLRFESDARTVTATFTKRPAQNRTLYLIPENAPVPSWWVTSKDAGTKVFYYPSGYEEAVTIIRTYPIVESFSNDEISTVMNKDAQKFLVVEACQSSIRLDAPGLDYRQLQERFCNSVAIAAFMRLHGYSYELYTRFTSVVPIMTPAGPISTLVFSKDEYEWWLIQRALTK